MNTNTLTKDEMIGRALYEIDTKKAFENLSLNGRYTQAHREEFKIISEKHSEEANLFMQLAYHWNN